MLSCGKGCRPILQLRPIDDNGRQAFLAEHGLQMRHDVGSEIPAVDDDAVSHELVGLVGSEFVNTLPERTPARQRSRCIGRRIEKNCFVVQPTEAGTKVVAVRVDEFESSDRISNLAMASRNFSTLPWVERKPYPA
jgi:hypothetical protein